MSSTFAIESAREAAVCTTKRGPALDRGTIGDILSAGRLPAPRDLVREPFCNLVSQATVHALPMLSQDDVCLREVHLSDAAALLALFAQAEVSAHLDPPPATIAEFGSWIALSQSRRADNRAACYTLITGNQKVSGLFMALRLDSDHRAEIGFAMAPALWGTGVFQKAVNLYLDFLFNEWGITTLIGKTLVRNGRGVGAMRKLGAKITEESVRNGQPEYVWTLERKKST